MEKDAQIAYIAKRLSLKKWWKSENCFGEGKHAVFSKSCEHPLKPYEKGRFKPIRINTICQFESVEQQGQNCKYTHYLHVDLIGKESRSNVHQVLSLLPSLDYLELGNQIMKIKKEKLCPCNK